MGDQNQRVFRAKIARRELLTWIDNHLGPTVQSQRGVLQAIFSAESVTKVG
jgi:hypothetical protein